MKANLGNERPTYIHHALHLSFSETYCRKINSAALRQSPNSEETGSKTGVNFQWQRRSLPHPSPAQLASQKRLSTSSPLAPAITTVATFKEFPPQCVQRPPHISSLHYLLSQPITPIDCKVLAGKPHLGNASGSIEHQDDPQSYHSSKTHRDCQPGDTHFIKRGNMTIRRPTQLS